MEWSPVVQSIESATGEAFQPGSSHSVGGGCINDAWILDGRGRSYFVKNL